MSPSSQVHNHIQFVQHRPDSSGPDSGLSLSPIQSHKSTNRTQASRYRLSSYELIEPRFHSLSLSPFPISQIEQLSGGVLNDD
ncbi:hypothetical protein L6452_03336 [Arctium lappa]|uniref:Uncharacterized protein n=1 Tax=Arctium lappa TaxID=4217 RepID=A0ACB9FMY2_ARCLA|nr:hypothetical protein L6452_03336 [Arctium lappa]